MEDKEQLSQEPIVDTENGAQTAPETEEAPLSEIDKMKADLADQKDKYLRLMAEFENFKRRTAKERVELIQTAGKDVIVSLLDVMDDCDRAEKQLNEFLAHEIRNPLTIAIDANASIVDAEECLIVMLLFA